jgi:uncharacterized DUF497 family protein
MLNFAGFDCDAGNRDKCLKHGVTRIRPISARFMHRKEGEYYEKTVAGSE